MQGYSIDILKIQQFLFWLIFAVGWDIRTNIAQEKMHEII